MSDFLSVDEACVILRFVHDDGAPNQHAFYNWKYRLAQTRHPLKVYRRGRRVLVKRADLEAKLTVEGVPSGLRKVVG